MRGFSLLELLIVLAIAAVIAVAAIPDRSASIIQVEVNESLQLVEPFRLQVEAYAHTAGSFPASNATIGLPEPNRLIGNYLVSATLESGAFQLRFGNKAHEKLRDKLVSLRPVFVPGSPGSPMSWICGNDTVPAGMQVAGINRTDLPDNFLPIRCRNRSGQP